MGRIGGYHPRPKLEGALQSLGEVPKWLSLKGGQVQHKGVKHRKVVVNTWKSGTVLLQGGDDDGLEEKLNRILNGGSVAPAAPPQAVMQAPDLDNVLHLYLDGSCPVNRQVHQGSAAGWGVAVFLGPGDKPGAKVCELYGPVITSSNDPLSIGAEVGSNNTGELSAWGEALLWLRDEAADALRCDFPTAATSRALFLYDSEYASNIARGVNRAHKNQDLAKTVQKLWREVGAPGRWQLTQQHVKGHSGNPGNELADQLAARGAAGQRSVHSRRWNGGAAVQARQQAAAVALQADVAAPPRKRLRLTISESPSPEPGGRGAGPPKAIAEAARPSLNDAMQATQSSSSASAPCPMDCDDLDMGAVAAAIARASAPTEAGTLRAWAKAGAGAAAAPGGRLAGEARGHGHCGGPDLAGGRRLSAEAERAKQFSSCEVLIGPLRGLPLEQAAACPEENAQLLADLQGFIAGEGLWDALLAHAKRRRGCPPEAETRVMTPPGVTSQ